MPQDNYAKPWHQRRLYATTMVLCATTKTWHSQINVKIFFFKFDKVQGNYTAAKYIPGLPRWLTGKQLEEEMATHSSTSCLENPMERGTWWATVHGVADSDMTEHARTQSTSLKVLITKGNFSGWATFIKWSKWTSPVWVKSKSCAAWEDARRKEHLARFLPKVTAWI